MPESFAAMLEAHLETARAVGGLLGPLEQAADAITQSLERGGTVYTFGNGGSACDANHFAEELTGRYRRERRPLRAVALTTDAAAITCIGNDYRFAEVFARPLSALARPGDVAVGISTSGDSENVVGALRFARASGLVTVALLGGDGGKAAALADHALIVPSGHTARIQEMHILLIHMFCERIDDWALGEA